MDNKTKFEELIKYLDKLSTTYNVLNMRRLELKEDFWRYATNSISKEEFDASVRIWKGLNDQIFDVSKKIKEKEEELIKLAEEVNQNG